MSSAAAARRRLTAARPGRHLRAFSLGSQYWTSRGFAILDVNYGGSTGFGRSYRSGSKAQWGVVDVDDSVTGAWRLVEQGRADPEPHRDPWR